MPKEYVDTYFLDSQTALLTANQNNRVNCTILVDGLQICYYAGEKLRAAPKNCIHVPIDKLYKYFGKTKNRLPDDVSYDNTYFTQEERKALSNKIINIMNSAIDFRNQLLKKYKKKIKQYKPDFSERPLRVFIPACRETVVMQHTAKSISDAFIKIGYDVHFHTQKNDMQLCCFVQHVKALAKYKAHITVNINHLNNDMLHKDVYNFVWFQDFMDIVKNPEKKMNLRKRDFIFSLYKDLDYYLDAKNIQYQRQSFCVNKKIFFESKTIKRKNKIVFIGHFPNLLREEFKKENRDIVNLVYSRLNNKKNTDYSAIKFLTQNLNVSPLDMYGQLGPVIIKYLAVEWLCQVSPIEIEIYGNDEWAKHDLFKKFYKGHLQYGDELRKVYNSAKYALIPTTNYLIMNRLTEAAACGCIPVVYDCRDNDNPPYFEDDLLYFNDKISLKEALIIEPKGNPKNVLKGNTFKSFAKKISKIVTKDKSCKN